MKLGSESRPDCDADGSVLSARRGARSWANAAGTITPNISTSATKVPKERPRHKIIGIPLPSARLRELAHERPLGKFAAKIDLAGRLRLDRLRAKKLKERSGRDG